ncbi:MAG TPA: hypothetical protein VJ697_11065 [Nitrososphaeraceae archaeon]|nr:hypothetical protein [Nitrososphaeraceae archaeon]
MNHLNNFFFLSSYSVAIDVKLKYANKDICAITKVRPMNMKTRWVVVIQRYSIKKIAIVGTIRASLIFKPLFF